MYRLDGRRGEWIDRSAILRFTFEGREYRGYAGDTISSALAAAGVAYLGRSFKYHRPRGIASFANHDSNAFFQVDGVPNVRGDVTPLAAGMTITAVNTFGGLARDKARILDRFGRLLPVGFYYKAFHTKALFPFWERMFRKLTGLGEVDLRAPRGETAKRFGFCDVLVIGAGASGLAAALAAARAGAKVTLADEWPRLGGGAVLGADGDAAAASVDAVLAQARITVLTRTVAVGYYADHWVALAEAARLTKMRARAVVFATGAIEQPAVFRNNDLPGVMQASGALRLANCYGVAPGRRVVIVAANLEAYAACIALLARGIAVAAVIDLRAGGEVEALSGQCARQGVQIVHAHAPYEAIRGPDGAVCALSFAPFDLSGRLDLSAVRRIDCDAVLSSVGWASASQLLSQAGGRLEFRDEIQAFVPARLPPGVFAAGRANGVYEFAARCDDGRNAGAAAAAHAGCGSARREPPAPPERRPSHPFPIIDHPSGKNFVDFDEDLQVEDLVNAAQEGFDSSELMKRYSTVGMGPSQGKHSNMHALRVLARARGMRVDDLGLTTARPMYHPVPLKLLAGRNFHVERRTPLDTLHAAHGAVWMSAGAWRRPEYYAVAGEGRAESIAREVETVRNRVGVIDLGTLGKIEVHGPQAAEFLDRAYAGTYSNLRAGTSRYALMLDESGVIVDDGVIARLGSERFYFTTTTSGSAIVFRELSRLNSLWGFDCGLVNLTGHRAAFNIAGPSSREVLGALTDLDLGESGFPHLGARVGTVGGHEAIVLRSGFVGELAFEVHLPATCAGAAWRAAHEAGKSHGLRPFGVEAQRALRLEKGHFIIGQDTDGLTDPFEADAGWAVNMEKPFFVGQRSLKILRARGPRQLLVGIEVDACGEMPKESHLIIDGGGIAGRVTSIAHSRTLGKIIGLAMVAPPLATPGRMLSIRLTGGGLAAARVVPKPFYDPPNLRQTGRCP